MACDFIKLLQECWSVSVRLMRPARLGSSGRLFALAGVLFDGDSKPVIGVKGQLQSRREARRVLVRRISASLYQFCIN